MKNRQILLTKSQKEGGLAEMCKKLPQSLNERYSLWKNELQTVSRFFQILHIPSHLKITYFVVPEDQSKLNCMSFYDWKHWAVPANIKKYLGVFATHSFTNCTQRAINPFHSRNFRLKKLEKWYGPVSKSRFYIQDLWFYLMSRHHTVS